MPLSRVGSDSRLQLGAKWSTCLPGHRCWEALACPSTELLQARHQWCDDRGAPEVLDRLDVCWDMGPQDLCPYLAAQHKDM